MLDELKVRSQPLAHLLDRVAMELQAGALEGTDGRELRQKHEAPSMHCRVQIPEVPVNL